VNDNDPIHSGTGPVALPGTREAGRAEATTVAESRLVHSSEAPDRRAYARPRTVQSAIDSKLRGCDVVSVRVDDCSAEWLRARPSDSRMVCRWRRVQSHPAYLGDTRVSPSPTIGSGRPVSYRSVCCRSRSVCSRNRLHSSSALRTDVSHFSLLLLRWMRAHHAGLVGEADLARLGADAVAAKDCRPALFLIGRRRLLCVCVSRHDRSGGNFRDTNYQAQLK